MLNQFSRKDEFHNEFDRIEQEIKNALTSARELSINELVATYCSLLDEVTTLTKSYLNASKGDPMHQYYLVCDKELERLQFVVESKNF
ncbi:hypothetical protein G6355_12270 [Vibrio cholerae]|uniref:Uncharacterized protein n=1 Tax=Vibrio cholerae TaxID=666 RepID=A0ABD7SRH9_VIBCL|nr:hypothetical protein [Vibrio cholerae]MVF55435.1 hypothetical protein [Vibrio cholerae]TXX67443.1 hypothetical protein FXF03_02360 [Vibrio cholerae]GIB00034.1 hypothetical protein VCSRO136_2494 [Vibrio cholerae]HAS5670715.1 hypothetical protein [Vibrio cholerae]HAS5696856.1 hypothetical protein [Vibrio cholerae]